MVNMPALNGRRRRCGDQDSRGVTMWGRFSPSRGGGVALGADLLRSVNITMPTKRMCLLISSLILCGTAYADSLVSVGSLNTARYGHTATLLQDGAVLIIGGHGLSSYSSSAELFDPTTNRFRAIGAMKSTRWGYTATWLPTGNVLVVGGNSEGSAEIYDVRTQQFRAVGSLAVPRSFHTATLLFDGTVLIAGGFDGTLFPDTNPHPTATTEIFDPASEAFPPGPPLLWKRAAHTATLLPDGRALLTGGDQERDEVAQHFITNQGAEFYDAVQKKTLPAPLMAAPRYGHEAVLLSDGRVALIGGVATNQAHGPLAELYNPYSGATDELQSSPGRAVLLANGKIFVAAAIPSLVEPTTRRARLMDIRLVGATWTEFEACTLTRLHDGRVLIAGGYRAAWTAPNGATADALIYTPDPPPPRHHAYRSARPTFRSESTSRTWR